ncbi:hypothetical protein FKM82_030492 [Ascaphus truei]
MTGVRDCRGLHHGRRVTRHYTCYSDTLRYRKYIYIPVFIHMQSGYSDVTGPSIQGGRAVYRTLHSIMVRGVRPCCRPLHSMLCRSNRQQETQHGILLRDTRD